MLGKQAVNANMILKTLGDIAKAFDTDVSKLTLIDGSPFDSEPSKSILAKKSLTLPKS